MSWFDFEAIAIILESVGTLAEVISEVIED